MHALVPASLSPCRHYILCPAGGPFTCVRQVGDIYLLASRDGAANEAAAQPLEQHQVWVLPSAHQPATPSQTASWASPSSLRLDIPIFPPEWQIQPVAGGLARWEGQTARWYDEAMEFPLKPALVPEPGAVQGASGLLRAWTGTYAICGRPVTRFQVAFPNGEITLAYTSDAPMVLAAYSLTSQPVYQRGDPRSWRLEAQVGALHR